MKKNNIVIISILSVVIICLIGGIIYLNEYYKKQLDRYGLRHYGKTEPTNNSIARALKNANSKSGGSGNNYPDIQLLLVNANRRSIPVMIEAKGTKNKLERLNTDHQIDMSKSSYIQGYAVNGALHYGNAILDEGTYSEVIIVGINGTEVDPVTGIVKDPELKAYYVAKKNSGMPKYIPDFDFVRCMPSNLGALFDELDTMSLSDAEREQIKRQTEQTLEERVKAIHQSIYDDPKLRVMLDTNGKLYLFCGLIMAGMPIAGAADLSPKDLTSNTTSKINDGTLIMDRIELFLESRESTQDKVNMVRSLFQPTFSTEGLWRPDDGGISILHTLYKQIKEEIGLDPRVTVLGHIQRGGTPSARDRECATRMGYHAVKALTEGRNNVIVATQSGNMVELPIEEALQMKKSLQMDRYEVMEAMASYRH